MFNRYWRTYPWFFQFFQLILLIAILFFFFVTGVGFVVIPWLTGVQLTDIQSLSETSPYAVVQAALIAQVLFSLSLFLVPSLLFAYATHPKPAGYLGLRKPGKPVQWLVVALLMTGLMPVLVQVGSWMSQFNWSADVKAEQAQQESIMKALINMNSSWDFIKVFFVVAILPAFGEEMLFRGIFMKFAAKKMNHAGLPILISGIMFALMHDNTYGFVSILMAGIILGLIYYWTSSLWCSILGHLINNGLQIILLYISKYNSSIARIFVEDQVPVWMFAAGLVLTLSGLFLLWKYRTPLPPNWSADYTEQELRDEEII